MGKIGNKTGRNTMDPIVCQRCITLQVLELTQPDLLKTFSKLFCGKKGLEFKQLLNNTTKTCNDYVTLTTDSALQIEPIIRTGTDSFSIFHITIMTAVSSLTQCRVWYLCVSSDPV